ncbi:MAG: glucokinase [Candidatus Electrothrix sp. AUS1_2]|nr:glucokinase [Candidatus Electrothrix sp. AUS1_2]
MIFARIGLQNIQNRKIFGRKDYKILLVGDVGRRVKLSIIEAKREKEKIRKEDLRILYENSRPLRSLSPEEMVQDFLKDMPKKGNIFPNFSGACFTVPGPVVNNSMLMIPCASEFTGQAQSEKHEWQITGKFLAEKFNLPDVTLINDYSAVCYGINLLSESDEQEKKKYFYLLKGRKEGGKENGVKRRAVIGAGTGLGKAFTINEKDKTVKVYATEGGHADFSPCTEEEFALYEFIQKDIKEKTGEEYPRVSVEKVVSGMGIIYIYKFLRKRYEENFEFKEHADIKREIETFDREREEAAKNREPQEQTVAPAAAIANAAIFKKDPLCRETMSLFLKFFGAEAGNFALKILPDDGLYLAGGIVPRILPLLDFKENNSFLEAFLNKGRMRRLLENIPIYVVLRQDVGVIGAAYCAAQLIEV